MPRAMLRHECFHCGQRVSTNGLAKASHMRKHVREGLLVEMRSTRSGIYSYHKDGRADWSTSYVTPETARRLLDQSSVGLRYRVVSGTPTPPEES